MTEAGTPSGRKDLVPAKPAGLPALPLFSMLGPEDPERAPVIGGPTRFGILTVLVFFVGFGGWAATAPIESAAIAPGTVSVESNRKTIQHLEGGIVREILVRDGDAVTAGQVLMRLDETQPGATLDILNARYDVAGAEFSRLAAERDGLKETIFPDWLTARRTDPAVATILENQRNIFAARRDAVTSQTAILQQRIAQLEEEIRGVEGRIAASARQSALIADELAGVRTLYEKGLMQKPRLLELERRAAEIDGTLASDRAAIARARQQIGEARLRISELRTTQVNEAAARIGELQGELLDLTERIRAATDVRGRTEIRAPQDGTVVGLSVHTPGGVIAPGERLLDIVPSGDRLIVEARVDPQDIDIVRAGLEARVRFTAFTQRNLVPVPGTVSWVSADHIADERTGTAYFLARIALAEDDPALGGNKLYPGMSAEVLIVTGSRTALEYMLQPLTDTLRRAFRES